MTWDAFLAKTPLSPEAQRDIARLETTKADYMPGLTNAQKKDKLSRISYKAFLLDFVKVHPDVVPFYQSRTHGLYGIGIDAVGALECWAYRYPGFDGMNLDPQATGRMSFTARGDGTPHPAYTFHFPDGNASVARLLVRALMPDALPGRTAQDSVLARVDYATLDRAGSPIRIRLSSTVARVRHAGSSTSARDVEVAYARDKKVYAVRARGVVLACWNAMIPYLCPELPDAQKEALKYGVKVPLVYTSVSLRNWRSFHALGINGASAPGMYHTGARLEMPTVIGGYNPTPASPDDPILVRMTRTPCKPGLPAPDQQRARSARARVEGRRVRSGARHRRDHRQPLAARLRVRIQPAVGSGLARGAVAVRNRPQEVRADHDGELGCRRRRVHRSGDRPGVPRCERAARCESVLIACWLRSFASSCGRRRQGNL